MRADKPGHLKFGESQKMNRCVQVRNRWVGHMFPVLDEQPIIAHITPHMIRVAHRPAILFPLCVVLYIMGPGGS